MAFALMVVQVSAGFIGLLPEGIMFAHHDFVVRNLVRIAGVLLRLCLTIGAADARRLADRAWPRCRSSVSAFDFGVSWLMIRRRYPGIRISLADFDWRRAAPNLLVQPVRVAAERGRAPDASKPMRSSSAPFWTSDRSRSTPSPTA